MTATPPTGQPAIDRRRALAAAVLRTLAEDGSVAVRGERVERAGRALPDTAPHLRVPPTAEAGRWRALADGWGLRLRLGDREAYEAASPGDPLARALYALLEQLRVESQVPTAWPGARSNLATAFDAWVDRCLRDRGSEGQLGVELLMIACVARSVIVGTAVPDRLADLFEAARGAYAGLLQPGLRRLRALRADPVGFAPAARRLAEDLAAALAGPASPRPAPGDADDGDGLTWWLEDPGPDDAGAAAGLSGRGAGPGADADGYRVFTRAHDRVVEPVVLVREGRVRELRARLDEVVLPMAGRQQRLAAQLHDRFCRPEPYGFDEDRPDGVLNPRRLVRLATAEHPTDLFRTPAHRPRPAAEVAVVLDCSGSMKARLPRVLPAIEVLCRALSLVGVAHRVLGCTTSSFGGGASARDWRRAGRPALPGRLGDRLDLRLVDSRWPWRRSRLNLAAAASASLCREAVIGEGVADELAGLAGSEAPERVLLVVTDGAPHETATALHNPGGLLAEHLLRVAADGLAAGIGVGAVGIGLDVSWGFEQRVQLGPDPTAPQVLQALAALLVA